MDILGLALCSLGMSWDSLSFNSVYFLGLIEGVAQKRGDKKIHWQRRNTRKIHWKRGSPRKI